MVLLNASTPIDPSDLLRNRRMQELHDKFFPTKKTQEKSEDRSTDVQTNLKNVFDMNQKDSEKVKAIHVLFRKTTDDWLPFKPQGVVPKDARSMAQLVRMTGDVQTKKLENPNMSMEEIYKVVGIKQRLDLMNRIDLGRFELEPKHSNTQELIFKNLDTEETWVAARGTEKNYTM